MADACRKEFETFFSRPWTEGLARRYALDPATSSTNDKSGALLLRLQQVMVDIGNFKDDPTVLGARNDGPLKTKLLLDWAARHPRLLASFPKWDAKRLVDPFDTPRQWLIRRVRSGAPQFLGRLKRGGEYSPRELAVISLLAGNFPSTDNRRFRGQGYTVAEIIDAETKYMRKYMKRA